MIEKKFQIIDDIGTAESGGIVDMGENKEKVLQAMRHSTAHVLAMAVKRLHPEALLATGPTIEDGFYYDFKFKKPIGSEDLDRIQQEMQTIKDEALPFQKVTVPIEQALDFMEKTNETYKAELISLIKETGNTEVVDGGKMASESGEIPETVTFFVTGDEFFDLCRGPHVADTSLIGEFHLKETVSSAHWRKSQGVPELTRIYGLGFATDEELKKHQQKIELAKERDHRRLGVELELFIFSEKVGQGLALWLPHGATVRKQMEKFIEEEQTKRGYSHVFSPHIGKKELWDQSGHTELYSDKMYNPITVENQEYLVKPMTCPIHCQMYNAKTHSYRDLPIRLAENAAVYRFEQSGELHGLLRVRGFTQDDAHIFATPEQVVDEFLGVFELTQFLLEKFGFSDYRIRVGIRSESEKYLGDDEIWKEAEQKILEAVDKTGVEYDIQKGEAAFYGPKADFLLKDVLGREWQCGTVQVDFMLPERLDLKFTDRDGKEKRPVMIHRAPLGSIERFFAILLENNGGAFSTWLAPVQAQVLSVSDDQLPYAKHVAEMLLSAGVRASVTKTSETLGKKIKNATKFKIPYVLVVGDNEISSNTVSVRKRGAEGKAKQQQINIEEFIDQIKAEIEAKS